MKKIKLARIDCEKVSTEIGDFVIEQVKYTGTTGCVVRLSGGVDSTTVAALIHKAIGDQLVCMFIDQGLMRKNEAKKINDLFMEKFSINFIHINAAQKFFEKLKGITDPEEKRKIIGENFIRTFEEEAKKLGAWANKKGDLRLESAAAKILGSEWYWDVVNDLFQVRGGRGFMTVESQRMSGEPDIPAMRMLRDARINLVWEGTSEILRIWMARESLAPYIEPGFRFLQGSAPDKLAALGYFSRMAAPV